MDPELDSLRAALWGANEPENGPNLVGITIVNARWLLDRDGAIVVTPPQLRVEADGLAEALAAA